MMGELWLASRAYAPASRQGSDSLDHVLHMVYYGGASSVFICILGHTSWKLPDDWSRGDC